jgi:carbamoyltransferase
MGTELDLLVAGRCVMRKQQQDPALRQNYATAFTPD